jgi:hypothetical protein
MTSATTKPASGTGHPTEGHGLIVFASVLLLVIGCAYGSRANLAA